MASQINPAYPVYGNPTTQSVRDNFAAAANEINALQADKVEQAPNGDVEVTGNLTVHESLTVDDALTVHGPLTVHEALDLHDVSVHFDNAAAHSAGLPVGRVYRDLLGILKIVH